MNKTQMGSKVTVDCALHFDLWLPRSKFLSIQDKNRTLQLPVTNLIVMCNGVSSSLSTTATEFTFTDAGCVSATAANITLTATNEAGSTMADTSVSPGEFDFHVYTPHYAYKTISVNLGRLYM